MAKKLKEQIDYGNRPERMDPSLERKLASPDSLYAQNPAMRKGAADVQRLVSQRFGKVADKLKEVTGNQNISSQRVQQMIYNEMMTKLGNIMRIEASHREQLEQLAVDACLEEQEVPEGVYQIEPHLGEQPDTSDFRYQPEEPEDDEEEEEEKDELEIPSFDVEDLTDEEELELEKHKRNIINALIQGAAKKGHYLFQKPDVKAKLDEIDPSLYRDYLGIMAINDFMYFTMEQMIEMMSQTGQGVAGKVSLDDADDEGEEGGGGEEGGEEQPDTKIVAIGLIFPILCHEIIKGLEEAKGRYGHSKNPEIRQKVRGAVDVLSNEPMQLRIGPEIVEKLRHALPDEMYDESNQGLTPWFHILLYQIPAESFLKIIGHAISEDQSKVKIATSKFKEIMKEAQKMKSDFDNFREDGESDDSNLNPSGGLSSYDDDEDSDVDYAPEEEDDDEDYLTDMDNYLDSLGIKRPDNLEDLLGGLGISLSK